MALERRLAKTTLFALAAAALLGGCGGRASVEVGEGFDAEGVLDGSELPDSSDASDESDASEVAADASFDAGAEAGRDAGVDAGVDAGAEAGRDAGVDAGVDAGSDAGRDAGVDAGIDAGRDAGIDAGVDAGRDAGVDAGVDAGRDAGLDAGTPPDSGSPTTVGSISVTTLTVSAGAISTSTQSEAGPYIALLPDGRTKVAWLDSTARKIYVRHLVSTSGAAERADTVLDGYKLFGLAAHPDGRCAVLTVTPAPAACTPCTASTACVSCDELHLVQLNAAGAIERERVIDDRLGWTGDFSGGAIAIGSWSNSEAYAVTRTVRGAGPDSAASAFCVSGSGNSGHQWQETWLYKTSDLSMLASGCNVFPCGHSLYRRGLAAHPGGLAGFGSTCISDYSGGRTGFNYAYNNGWNNRLYNVWQDWPSFTNGGTPSELVPATSTTYLVSLSAPRSCASDCASDHHDVALMEVSFDTRRVVGGPYWLTALPSWEKFPHLARYGAGFLLGWTTSSSATGNFTTADRWWLAEIGTGGSVLAGPEDISGITSFSYGSTWATDPGSGDVVWVRRASATTLEIVRVTR